MPSNTRSYGNLGEKHAVKLLKNKGYKIIGQNYKSKFGEIDIVAIDYDTLVFVEVKIRKSKKFGTALESVSARQIYRVKRAGQLYTQQHTGLPKKMRIDVVAIQVKDNKLESEKIVKNVSG